MTEINRCIFGSCIPSEGYYCMQQASPDFDILFFFLGRTKLKDMS